MIKYIDDDEMKDVKRWEIMYQLMIDD